MKRSAGILLYRRRNGKIEVLLVHPGGPFFAKRDAGSWTVPKGLVGEGESNEEAAVREFEEETSFVPPEGSLLPLGEITQKGGKIVVGFAVEGNCDAAGICSNTFEMQWPPKSGRMQTFPEIDRAEWFDLSAAREKIMEAQRPFLNRLRDHFSE